MYTNTRPWFTTIRKWCCLFSTKCHSKLPKLANHDSFVETTPTPPLSEQHKANSTLNNKTNNKFSNISCRAGLEKTEKDGLISDVLIVEICGSIQTSSDTQGITVHVEIMDVTEANLPARPVMARSNQAQGQGSSAFRYEADLGKVLQKSTTLTNWTPVARIYAESLLFPRRGKRNVLLKTALLSSQSKEKLAYTSYNLVLENKYLGYIDLRENEQHTNMLAVCLAFAVSAADNKLPNCETNLIKTWARENLELQQVSGKTWRKLKKELKKTTKFFRNGGRLNCFEICREIVQISPPYQRYDILSLCLHVAKAKGTVNVNELSILKNLARWLEVDMDKFRELMEKILPANIHEVRDIEAILGLTADVHVEYARKKLNKEYAKWNSRVTNSDPQVQNQADMMLKIIADARNEYVGEKQHNDK